MAAGAPPLVTAMRYCALISTLLVIAGCASAPVSHTRPPAEIPARSSAQEMRDTPPDSVVRFLISSAAADFHTHGPSQIVRFRDVRLGYSVTLSGEKQYVLCGQFLRRQNGDSTAWVPFSTVRTSGYEQSIGAQAEMYCRTATAIPYTGGDLTFMLQSRFESFP